MKLLPLHSANAVEISSRTPLVLASTSRYRAGLLARLGVPFEQQAPGTEERVIAGEAPDARARRLASEKARAVTVLCPQRWVLGSDQVAFVGKEILNKPGSPAANVEQLLRLSGKEATFATAITLSDGLLQFNALDLTVVQFRKLKRDAIERYVAAEPAHDCAGGFKVEGLGITLFESVKSRDPTGLIGLPLIALSQLLEQAGLTVP